MSADNLFRFWTWSGFFDSSDVQGTVLALKRAHTAHIIPIVGELVTSEAVLGSLWTLLSGVRELVEIVAFIPIGATPTSEEEAVVLVSGLVRPCPTSITLDIASSLGFGLAVGGI
jgi:hypothetical protein